MRKDEILGAIGIWGALAIAAIFAIGNIFLWTLFFLGGLTMAVSFIVVNIRRSLY